jgi:outer membrane lipoprotein-sorting protein
MIPAAKKRAVRGVSGHLAARMPWRLAGSDIVGRWGPRAIVMAVIAVCTLPLAGAEQRTPLEELMGRVQERYRTLSDLRSRFHQSTTPRKGVAPTLAQGDWLVLTPGRLRVQYDVTDRLFVADGERLYWYLPEDNQVQILSAESIDPRYTPTLYLAAEGDLREDFTISGIEWDEPLSPGNIQIRLEPRSQDVRFRHLVVEVEQGSALIARFVSVGLLGEITEYRFSDIETNVGLADELFQFNIPPDAQVEYLGS